MKSSRNFASHLPLAIATLVLALLVALITGRAQAADVTASWTNPVQNTNGTAIPATGAGSIAQNRVQWGTCSGTAFGTAIGAQTIPAATSHVVTLPPGTYCFRVFAINTYSETSPASNVAPKVVPAPVPNPPVLAVPVIAGMLQTPVYSVTAAGAISTHVGYVDVGTACAGRVLATYRKAQFREVARADVKFWGSTSLRLAAPCA